MKAREIAESLRFDLSHSMDAAMSSWGSAALVSGQPAGLVNPAEVRYTQLVDQPWRPHTRPPSAAAAAAAAESNGAIAKTEPFVELKQTAFSSTSEQRQKLTLNPVSASSAPAPKAEQQTREWEMERPVEEGLRSLLEEPQLPSASARLLAADLSLNPSTGALTARSLLPLTSGQRHPLAFALPPLSSGPAASLLGTCAEFQATTTRPLQPSVQLQQLPVENLPRVLFVSSRMPALEVRLSLCSSPLI